MPADTESEGILCGVSRADGHGAAGVERRTAGEQQQPAAAAALLREFLISDSNKFRRSKLKT